MTPPFLHAISATVALMQLQRNRGAWREENCLDSASFIEATKVNRPPCTPETRDAGGVQAPQVWLQSALDDTALTKAVDSRVGVAVLKPLPRRQQSPTK